MTHEATADLLGEPFRIDSIVEAPAPAGGEGVWHRYVIVQGTNRINGLRAGTRSEVSLHVEDVVTHLNERFRKGKAGATDGFRGTKSAPASVDRVSADPASPDSVRKDID